MILLLLGRVVGADGRRHVALALEIAGDRVLGDDVDRRRGRRGVVVVEDREDYSKQGFEVRLRKVGNLYLVAESTIKREKSIQRAVDSVVDLRDGDEILARLDRALGRMIARS